MLYITYCQAFFQNFRKKFFKTKKLRLRLSFLKAFFCFIAESAKYSEIRRRIFAALPLASKAARELPGGAPLFLLI